MIETPSPSTASRPLGRAPASMHAGLGPAVLVRRNDITLSLCHALAQCLCDEHGASPEQIREAVALLESTLRTSQRVFGRAHPNTKRLEGDLAIARLMLPRP